MEKLEKYSWLILVHVAIMVLAMMLYSYIRIDKLYFCLVAFAWCIIPFYLLYCFYNTPRAKYYLIIWSAFALNNLFDELLFEPEKLSWNELLIANITLLIVLFLWIRKRLKK